MTYLFDAHSFGFNVWNQLMPNTPKNYIPYSVRRRLLEQWGFDDRDW